MIYVANEFTPEEGRDKYLKAAKAFRMPFWGNDPQLTPY